ncbi:bifunctional adenosylcobinamide kinase/adenosylcobinamide-phosphate guanylyltransferase [Sphaerochaeta globosa]|uniref:Adenosylcobinamide kinase n=1 Tax=Sphaerochaeta globosa (strain ATCC BAA-1886 / DSM 22777 / Buddy) TaxID=158189 RepID=F0RYE1_SPHGB|nr:bifunctional adenosylcobinamide kinase/adenosylcobinamide-phosphate guanylyltransferase [Sphaerochaeta globosa]ADY12712.1 Adenosylcobinamide-phosphate guanylyltransferase [Sphaerochaeta globosa str. Buddy]
MATIDLKKTQIMGYPLHPGKGTLVSTTGGVRIHTRLKSQVSLIIGGGRSGKSSYSQDYALNICEGTESRAYIATAEPIDEEMKQRIAAHQQDRGERFITIEENLDLAKAIRDLPPSVEVCVVDCLTVWLGNLLHHYGIPSKRFVQMDALYEVLRNPPCEILLVTNETGLGLIPADAESRSFRDLAGWMNQDIAQIAQNVILLVAGLPLALKGKVL